jgi:hypothetical protein
MIQIHIHPGGATDRSGAYFLSGLASPAFCVLSAKVASSLLW